MKKEKGKRKKKKKNFVLFKVKDSNVQSKITVLVAYYNKLLQTFVCLESTRTILNKKKKSRIPSGVFRLRLLMKTSSNSCTD